MGALPVELWGAGEGWLMAEIGEVHIGYNDSRVGHAAQMAYLDCQERAIVAAAERGFRRCVINYVPSVKMDSIARKRFGDMLNRHKEKLASTTMSYVMVTPSGVARGVMTAVLWLAPPPYPYAVVGTVEEATSTIQQVDNRINAALYARECLELIRGHVPNAAIAV